jgi:acetolactate synthase small subunit
MLKKAIMTKQISITVINKIGVLDIMAGYLADRGINIEAVAGYEIPGSWTTPCGPSRR